MRLATLFSLLVGCVVTTTAAQGQSGPRTDFKFIFGPGSAPPGYTQAAADTLYSTERGFGFEPNTVIPAPGAGAPQPASRPSIVGIDRQTGDPVRSSLVTSDKIFLFSVAVPTGNYRVTVTLGDAKEPSTTTVKAESRLLMLERVHTEPGQFVTRSFTVNIHGPKLPDGSSIKLDTREIGVFHWDDKITLEFADTRPALVSLEVHKVDDAVTVFLCGDSTVTNQVREPYGTWGQMLPRWFDDHVAIADYAESGETLKAFKMEHRLEKVLSEIKKGDYVFLQFGHNDLNQRGHNGIWPAADHDGDWAVTYSPANTDYKTLLKEFAGQIKDKGGMPVIVSPMTKIQIGTGELNIAGLGDYPKAAVEAAKEADVTCIDLNAMSIEVVKALGPEAARRAYVEGLHTNSYGGYILSRCIAAGIMQKKLELAKYLVADASSFDPAHPLPLPADFKLPLEPGGTGMGRGLRGGRRGPATTQTTNRGN
jgi:lysophospholipase L1-like esterase